MSATDENVPELTDPELISRVRDGDVGAYGTLFSRHVDAATRLARILVGSPDADDLVSEAFVKVLNVLLGGGGPDVAFRAYLLTSVRRLHIDKVRSQQKLTTAGDMTPFDPGVPFTDTAVAGFEGGAAAKAFASLPERWQLVLWHLEVENQKPADIAPLLGMSANSVSALAYRAREGLRQAFLNMHSGDLTSDACRDTNDLMGGYVRHALSRRDTAKVEDHLDHCRRCTAVYLELAEVNSSLAGLLGPVLLGGAAAAYLGGGTAAVAGATTGVLALVGRARDVALANVPATAAATATAVGVAGVTAIAIANRGPSETPAAAKPPQDVIVAPSQTPSPDTTGPTGRADGNLAARNRAASGTGTTGSTEGTGSGSLFAPLSSADADPTADLTTSALGGDGGNGDGNGGDNGGGNGNGGNGNGGNGNGNGNGGNGGNGTGPTKPSHPETSEPGKPTDPTTEPSNPTTPTPTQPSRTMDIGLSASVFYDSHRHLHVRVNVTGDSKGQRVNLHASITHGGIHSHNGFQCHRSGNSFDCTLSSGASLLFGTYSHGRPILTFSVTPPSGWTDTSSGNDSISRP